METLLSRAVEPAHEVIARVRFLASINYMLQEEGVTEAGEKTGAGEEAEGAAGRRQALKTTRQWLQSLQVARASLRTALVRSLRPCRRSSGHQSKGDKVAVAAPRESPRAVGEDGQIGGKLSRIAFRPPSRLSRPRICLRVSQFPPLNLLLPPSKPKGALLACLRLDHLLHQQAWKVRNCRPYQI